MIDPEMLRITQINQSVVTAPAVGMNHGFNPDTPANNGLQRVSLDVRNDFGKDFAVAFIDSKDNRFAACSATAFAFDTVGAKVRFVNFALRLKTAKREDNPERGDDEFSNRFD